MSQPRRAPLSLLFARIRCGCTLVSGRRLDGMRRRPWPREVDMPEPEPAPAREHEGFPQRLLSLLSPVLFAWVAKEGPPKQRFRAGPHLHGLEEHDLVDRPAEFK